MIVLRRPQLRQKPQVAGSLQFKKVVLGPVRELSIASNFSSGDAMGFVLTEITMLLALRSNSPPTMFLVRCLQAQVHGSDRRFTGETPRSMKPCLPGLLLWRLLAPPC